MNSSYANELKSVYNCIPDEKGFEKLLYQLIMAEKYEVYKAVIESPPILNSEIEKRIALTKVLHNSLNIAIDAHAVSEIMTLTALLNLNKKIIEARELF